jgi:hypothetical protein
MRFTLSRWPIRGAAPKPDIVTTADLDWSRCVLDFSHDENDGERFETLEEVERHPYHNLFDEYSSYRKRAVAQISQILHRNTGDEFEDLIDERILHSSRQDACPPHWNIYSHE